MLLSVWKIKKTISAVWLKKPTGNPLLFKGVDDFVQIVLIFSAQFSAVCLRIFVFGVDIIHEAPIVNQLLLCSTVE